jgi:hypothetical protein
MLRLPIACQFNPLATRAFTPDSCFLALWCLRTCCGRVIVEKLRGHLYILAAIDYFSKWAEAATLKEIKNDTIINFIWTNIIYRYEVPRYIITNNRKELYNTTINKLCAQFSFKQHNSFMYNALANGLAEAFNKTICNIFKNLVNCSKKDGHDRIEESLWACHTTF